MMFVPCLVLQQNSVGEVLFFAFKLPDVLAKFCVVLARFVVEQHVMVSETSFKFCGSKT